jgi:methionyl-tRNA formyltransferase
MIREIDAGPIIQVNRFAINPNENYLALRSRTGPKCHRLLTDIVGILANDGDVPKSNEVWGPRLYKLAELPPEVQIALTDVAVPTKPAPIASTRRTAPAPKHAVNE